MASQRNHYEVLGVTRRATTDEIKKKYRELARKFHPDKVKDKELGQKVFAQINKAYSTLADPDKRAQYDASLAAESAHPQGAAASAAKPGGTPPAATGPLSPQQTANIARLIAEAEQAMMQNKIGNVPQICDLILKTDPRNTTALGIKGDALTQMGMPQQAAAAYRQALQIAPSSLLQAKLARLERSGGGAAAPAANGVPPRTPPTNGTPPRTPPPSAPPTNGTAQRTDQNRTEQGRNDKPSGGLFNRLLGKK